LSHFIVLYTRYLSTQKYQRGIKIFYIVLKDYYTMRSG